MSLFYTCFLTDKVDYRKLSEGLEIPKDKQTKATWSTKTLYTLEVLHHSG